MTNHNVITLKLSDVYSLSLVQGKAVTNYADSYAELALIRTDDLHDAFVPCNAWCPEWAGEDYLEDVLYGCDAYDVADLINYAKQYVYTREHKNVSP